MFSLKQQNLTLLNIKIEKKIILFNFVVFECEKSISFHCF